MNFAPYIPMAKARGFTALLIKRKKVITSKIKCGHHVTKYCPSFKIADSKCGHHVTKKVADFQNLNSNTSNFTCISTFQDKKEFFSLYNRRSFYIMSTFACFDVHIWLLDVHV